MAPPAWALVLCVDEKHQIQALDRTQPVLPMRHGKPERRSHDYLAATLRKIVMAHPRKRIDKLLPWAFSA